MCWTLAEGADFLHRMYSRGCWQRNCVRAILCNCECRDGVPVASRRRLRLDHIARHSNECNGERGQGRCPTRVKAVSSNDVSVSEGAPRACENEARSAVEGSPRGRSHREQLPGTEGPSEPCSVPAMSYCIAIRILLERAPRGAAYDISRSRSPTYTITTTRMTQTR